jgi:murein DD-endopeptidase MepM/ murein hydrolase activator NlpD
MVGVLRGCLKIFGCLGWIVLAGSSLFAQKENYPQGYFALPVYPGKPNTLSGALGDLRTNHFHAGIDVRTQRVEGLPISAAADGYVSRIAVQRAGYGKVIYVKHLNGMTTVYAHLQKFNEEIGAYVREEQYKAQSFEISLTPEAGRFPVKKGQLIAISGNTGSSEGPHLHFEIRDSRDNCLNPLFFNFPEIKDTTPPRFVSIALAPQNVDSRVNGRIDRQTFRPLPAKSGSVVSIKDTIRATGVLGLELQAFDRMDGTGFNYGLNCIEVRVDGEEIFGFNMEKFHVDVARDYNNLINYKARVEDRERYYKCYNPEGNTLNIYQTDDRRGRIWVSDTLAHQVEIRIFDSFENWSALTFVLKGEAAPKALPGKKGDGSASGLKTEIAGSVLKMDAPHHNGSWFLQGKEVPVQPSYTEGGRAVFLWDLKRGLPDSLQVGKEIERFSFLDKVAPRKVALVNKGPLSIRFDEKSLFDTLYLQVSTVGNTLQINEPAIPLRGGIEVAYRPSVDDSLKGKTHIYRLVNGREAFVGGEWVEGEVRFKSRELGTFYPITDKDPPRVRVLESSPKLISARITDDLSGIASFKANVNGEWVLMNYEYKNNYIWSEKTDNSIPFEGEVILEVTDRAGNVTRVKTNVAEVKKAKPRR